MAAARVFYRANRSLGSTVLRKGDEKLRANLSRGRALQGRVTGDIKLTNLYHAQHWNLIDYLVVIESKCLELDEPLEHQQIADEIAAELHCFKPRKLR